VDIESGLQTAFIEYQAIDRFVVNAHAFHNAHRLRETLPRSLVAPITLYQDRPAKHIEMAASETKLTPAKTLAANKKIAATQGEVVTSSVYQKRKRSGSTIAEDTADECSSHFVVYYLFLYDSFYEPSSENTSKMYRITNQICQIKSA
jgi:hypothetical protein